MKLLRQATSSAMQAMWRCIWAADESCMPAQREQELSMDMRIISRF